MPNRRHTSFVIEHQGGVYWFDAGEGCAHTAHLLGVDLQAVQAIFISHVHMDHVGGLANLLWAMQKLGTGAGERQGVMVSRDSPWSLSGKTVPVFIPNMNVGRGVLDVLAGPTGRFRADFSVDAHSFGDGVIYEENGLRVEALHNRHLGEPPEGETWQSFSFRIEAEGKSVVFSGDVADVSEPGPLLDECDLFLMETGHHRAEDVAAYLKESQKDVRRLGFVHHGRAVLADPDGELRKARAVLVGSGGGLQTGGAPLGELDRLDKLDKRVFIADDGMSVDV